MSEREQLGFVMLGVVLTLIVLLVLEVVRLITNRTRGDLPGGAELWEAEHPVAAGELRKRGVDPESLTGHMRDGAVDAERLLLQDTDRHRATRGAFRIPGSHVPDNPVACLLCGSLVPLDLTGQHRDGCHIPQGWRP